MFRTIFSSDRINHRAFVSKFRTISTSLFKSLELFADAILRLASANCCKIYSIFEAVFLMRCYKFHGLSPCYILHRKAFAESCNRK